jgi:hypothetical protein
MNVKRTSTRQGEIIRFLDKPLLRSAPPEFGKGAIMLSDTERGAHVVRLVDALNTWWSQPKLALWSSVELVE